MDTKLLDILACPICKGPLKLSADKTELISKGAGLAYPIRDGIPVMLESEARTLTTDERLDKWPLPLPLSFPHAMPRPACPVSRCN